MAEEEREDNGKDKHARVSQAVGRARGEGQRRKASRVPWCKNRPWAS